MGYTRTWHSVGRVSGKAWGIRWYFFSLRGHGIESIHSSQFPSSVVLGHDLLNSDKVSTCSRARCSVLRYLEDATYELRRVLGSNVAHHLAIFIINHLFFRLLRFRGCLHHLFFRLLGFVNFARCLHCHFHTHRFVLRSELFQKYQPRVRFFWHCVY